MTAQTKQHALRALDGMAQVVEDERLVRGTYFKDTDPKVCNGPRACAIGSLWLGAGVQPRKGGRQQRINVLPGTLAYERDEFVDERPGLALALGALNQEAETYAAAYELDLEDEDGDPTYEDAIEALFELHYRQPEDNAYTLEADGVSGKLTRDHLLALIGAAKNRIEHGAAYPRETR